MDIYDEIVRLRKLGQKCALATIVQVRGSIPSYESAKLLVRDGLLTALRLMDIIVRAGKPLADLVSDLLLAVGGISADDPAWSAKFRARYAQSPDGSPLPILVRRAGREITLTARLHFVPRVIARLIENPRPSAKARRVREGILRGTTRP